MRFHHRQRTDPAPSGHERGAVLVELAIVAMFLVTLLAAGFDLGMAWRSGLAVTEAARAGARVGSGVGRNVNADRDLLLSAKAALSSAGLLDDVRRVVIYRADATGKVPATCKTATGSVNGCNIVSGAQLAALKADTALLANGCVSAWSSKGYCPTTRIDLQDTAESVGVWIQVDHDYLFRMFGATRSIERTAVMRIEPRESMEGP